MYHHTSNYIKSEIKIYTEINASNARNKIALGINIYTEINASNVRNQIGLEIKIYIEINASKSTSTQKSMHLVQEIKYN